MNRVAKAANGLWSLSCLLVAGVLVGLGIYWAILQQPFLAVQQGSPSVPYTVTAGSILYVENPVVPAEFVGKINYTGVLIQDEFTRYVLPSPDMASIATKQGAELETVVQPMKPAAPLYAVFIPSYVRPGTYRYVVTASYRLNPFRTATLELPHLIIKVE
jgi:hypothetical protein